MSESPDLQAPPGVVELREDIPLKASGSGYSSARLCVGGPRGILAAFSVLTAAVTIALLTQIYYGDYEVVPHGSVSSSAAACSRAGTAALRAGGRAVDAAAASALCLAVLAPHRTSLDASGSLIYWEYRASRAQLPTIVEWGEETGASVTTTTPRPPRLLVALAALHARLGVLPWTQILQPAIDLAREGYPVTASLAAAAEARSLIGYTPAALRTEPALADYLDSLKYNTSTDLCSNWSCTTAVRWNEGVKPVLVGPWRIWAGGAGGALATRALTSALPGNVTQPTPGSVFQGVVENLKTLSLSVGEQWPRGVASGLAVADPLDIYVALVTGLSSSFGSNAGASEGADTAWSRDEPTTPLDLAPAIITDQHICGTRYIIGAESGVSLAEGAAAALSDTSGFAANAIEGARVAVLGGGELAAEPGRVVPAFPDLPALPALNATVLPAFNFVQQKGDSLLSHADSRGGGLASRF